MPYTLFAKNIPHLYVTVIKPLLLYCINYLICIILCLRSTNAENPKTALSNVTYCPSMHLFPDINECLSNNGNCSQTCSNTNGSYICSCQLGYAFHFDHRSCYGMSSTVKYILLLPFKIQQTSMNVTQTMEIALSLVQTPMEATSAHAILVTSWRQITNLAMVSCIEMIH